MSEKLELDEMDPTIKIDEISSIVKTVENFPCGMSVTRYTYRIEKDDR